MAFIAHVPKKKLGTNEINNAKIRSPMTFHAIKIIFVDYTRQSAKIRYRLTFTGEGMTDKIFYSLPANHVILFTKLLSISHNNICKKNVPIGIEYACMAIKQVF